MSKTTTMLPVGTKRGLVEAFRNLGVQAIVIEGDEPNTIVVVYDYDPAKFHGPTFLNTLTSNVPVHVKWKSYRAQRLLEQRLLYCDCCKQIESERALRKRITTVAMVALIGVAMIALIGLAMVVFFTAERYWL